MENKIAEQKEKAEFGPVFSRLYSFFSSRSRSQRKVYSTITEDVASFNPTSILEMGSGPGIEAAMIAQRIPHVKITCIDPSPTMVKIANDRFTKLSINDRAVSKVGYSSDTGIEGKFDIIFCSQSFHHWENGIQDVANLMEKHMVQGTFIIYESLVADSGKDNKSRHRHGMSREFAESTEVQGTVKTVKIQDGLVTLRFTKKK